MLAQTPQSPSAPTTGASRAIQRDRRLERSLNSRAKKAVENLERLEADKELIYKLSLDGWKGALWDRFQRGLAEYGYPIMRAWLYSGHIFVECARKGIPVKRRRVPITADGAKEMANDTVGYGIAEFRTGVLMPGVWDPTKKATLTTFFVGQCVLQFPNAYRRWVIEQCEPPEDERVWSVEPSIVPAAQVESPAILSEFLATVEDDDDRLIRAAMELGHEQQEIAQMLGVSVRAVESRVYRLNRDGEP